MHLISDTQCLFTPRRKSSHKIRLRECLETFISTVRQFCSCTGFHLTCSQTVWTVCRIETILLVYRIPSYLFTNSMNGLSHLRRPRMSFSWPINYIMYWQCASVRETNLSFTDSSFKIWRNIFAIIQHSYNTTIASHFSTITIQYSNITITKRTIFAAVHFYLVVSYWQECFWMLLHCQFSCKWCWTNI